MTSGVHTAIAATAIPAPAVLPHRAATSRTSSTHPAPASTQMSAAGSAT